MPIETVNLGVSPNDGLGEGLRVGGEKINRNATKQQQLQDAVGVDEATTELGAQPAETVSTPITPAELADLDWTDADSIKRSLGRLWTRMQRLGDASGITLRDDAGTERTFRVHQDGSVSLAGGPRIRPKEPTFTRLGMQRLWSVARYNQNPGFSVPAEGDRTRAREARFYVASAPLPEDFLLDGGHFHLTGEGSITPDSADTRLIPGIEIGQRGGGTSLTPDGAQVRPNLPAGVLLDKSVGGICEVGCMTTGENSVDREAGERVFWDLDVKVYFRGNDGTGKPPGTGGADQNVRVVGRLRFGELQDGVSHGAGPVFLNRNRSWDEEAWSGQTQIETGEIIERAGRGYRAIGPVPLETAGDFDAAIAALAAVAPDGTTGGNQTAINALRDALIPALDREAARRDYSPGGRFSRHWWYERVEEVPIDFTVDLNLRSPDLWFHFTMGGAWQTDVTLTPAAWADATTYQRTIVELAAGVDPDNHPDIKGMVVEQDGTGIDIPFIARRDHVSSPATRPAWSTDPDGEWRAYWRQIGPTKQDRLMVYGTQCVAVAGRNGISDKAVR